MFSFFFCVCVCVFNLETKPLKHRTQAVLVLAAESSASPEGGSEEIKHPQCLKSSKCWQKALTL